MFSEIVYVWLNNALDMGISEDSFWNMTLAELQREFASRKRVIREKAQQQASFDYILADLIGRSIGRIYSSSTTIPEIAAVYPSLFDTKEIEEKRAAKKAELSALRFRQFTHSFNKRFAGGVSKDE